VVECVRHTGKPFARRHNLTDHLRHLHGITNKGDGPQLRNIASAASDLVKAPISHLSDMGDEMIELQQLRADGLNQDNRIRELEERGPQSEALLKSLEDKLAQLTQQYL
jgi:hypothetical protein